VHRAFQIQHLRVTADGVAAVTCGATSGCSRPSRCRPSCLPEPDLCGRWLQRRFGAGAADRVSSQRQV